MAFQFQAATSMATFPAGSTTCSATAPRRCVSAGNATRSTCESPWLHAHYQLGVNAGPCETQWPCRGRGHWAFGCPRRPAPVGWGPAPLAREWPAVSPVGHMQGTFLPPGPGLYPHLPKIAKDAIRDLPPIFNTAMVSSHDTGPHMVQHCEAISIVTWRRLALIISCLAHQVVIPTSLMRSYLLRCLMEICLHMLQQYDKHHCFHSLVKDSTQNQWDAQQDTSKALAGESAKLLMTSIDGKCFAIKMHFPQTYLMPASAVGALAWLPLRISYFLPESTPSVAWLPRGDPCFTWSHLSVIWHRHHTDFMSTTSVGAWSVYHRAPLVSILCCQWLGTNTPLSAYGIGLAPKGNLLIRFWYALRG